MMMFNPYIETGNKEVDEKNWKEFQKNVNIMVISHTIIYASMCAFVIYVLIKCL